MIDTDAAVAAAAPLAAAAGLAAPRAAERLAGGKNNRVFKLALDDGGAAVLKSYFHDARDTRDRLGAEWGFITYAWERGVRALPRPLAIDRDRHLGLFSFAPGRKLAAADITAAHVDAALAFVLAVNAAPRATDALPPGSEACFSLSQHLDTVERRVARLATLDPDTPLAEEAQRFVRTRLTPLWAAARAHILAEARALGVAADAPLAADGQILSPSDFGFHNALADGDALTFIDFEYAGRDDPAKLASDFFCCPEIPTPIGAHARFVSGLVAGLGLDDGDAARCRLLLDAYRIKWTCIILNHFLPGEAARRAFADHAASEARCAAQLARAEAKLGEIAAAA